MNNAVIHMKKTTSTGAIVCTESAYSKIYAVNRLDYAVVIKNVAAFVFDGTRTPPCGQIVTLNHNSSVQFKTCKLKEHCVRLVVSKRQIYQL